MQFNKLRVDIDYKNGNHMFYENVSEIAPLTITGKVMIRQDLTEEEMGDFGLDVNEDDPWICVNFVGEFAKYRGDLLTSDREVAAFGFAMEKYL